MARTKSLFQINGKLDGYCFYTINGIPVVRKIGVVGKKRYMKDPSFKKMRENNLQFGGAAKIGQILRGALAPYSKILGDSYISARLQAVIKRMIRTEYRQSGKLFFSLQGGKNLLRGFEFNKNKRFDSIFKSKISLEINKKRNAVTLTLPEFKSNACLNAPAGATHFRLILAIALLSNYQFNKKMKQFNPVNASINGLSGLSISKEMQVRKMTGIDIQLKVLLTGAPEVPSTVGIVACVGIEFLQKAGGEYYLMEERNGMKVAEVF